jgi:hypothetical protein
LKKLGYILVEERRSSDITSSRSLSNPAPMLKGSEEPQYKWDFDGDPDDVLKSSCPALLGILLGILRSIIVDRS